MTPFRSFVLAALLVAAPAAAQGFQDLDLLERRLIGELGPIGEPGGPLRPLDRRLKLAACPSSPTLTMPLPSAALLQCEPLGWRIHVPLARAAVAPVQRAEPVIRKGDQVEVVALGGGFTVSTLAVAQQDGVVGDRIRVRGDGKATAVTARVDAPGRVTISQFN